MPPPAADPLSEVRRLIAENRRDEALRAVDALAPAATPDDLHRAADLFQSAGELDCAIELYRLALRPTPRLATLNNLGIALRKRGDARAALVTFEQAQLLGTANTLVPASLLNNIGNLHRQLGDIDAALRAFGASLAARPDDPDTLANRAAALLDAGRISEAIFAYRRAAQIDPDHAAAGSLLYALHVLPFDAAALAAEHNAWGDRYAGLADPAPFANDRDLNRRLRVGLISPNFETHAVGRFLRPLIEHVDRSAVAFVCYSDVARDDAMTVRFRAAAAEWRSITGLGAAAVARQIRDDRIDILIDLSLHMEGSRLKVFARRAAPVQATYLAYCSTSGLAALDYRLTDPHLDPPVAPNVFREKPVRLAHSYWCYPPPPDAPPVRPPPVTKCGQITFGCLNNFRKISSPALATWCELLKAVPTSRLIVHAHRGAHRDAFRAAMTARGVDGHRVEFQAFEHFDDYLASYHAIDIALDTFPYTGGTTTCDAMWMGVPVVTLAGTTPVARGGVSLLENVGLSALIAPDADAYVEIAASLAGDAHRLVTLRSALRERMQSSPLMQADLFCRDFEAACRAMWRIHCDA